MASRKIVVAICGGLLASGIALACLAGEELWLFLAYSPGSVEVDSQWSCTLVKEKRWSWLPGDYAVFLPISKERYRELRRQGLPPSSHVPARGKVTEVAGARVRVVFRPEDAEFLSTSWSYVVWRDGALIGSVELANWKGSSAVGELVYLEQNETVRVGDLVLSDGMEP